MGVGERTERDGIGKGERNREDESEGIVARKRMMEGEGAGW